MEMCLLILYCTLNISLKELKLSNICLQMFVFYFHVLLNLSLNCSGGRHGRDSMVVGFTTTYSISAYHH